MTSCDQETVKFFHTTGPATHAARLPSGSPPPRYDNPLRIALPTSSFSLHPFVPYRGFRVRYCNTCVTLIRWLSWSRLSGNKIPIALCRIVVQIELHNTRVLGVVIERHFIAGSGSNTCLRLLRSKNGRKSIMRQGATAGTTLCNIVDEHPQKLALALYRCGDDVSGTESPVTNCRCRLSEMNSSIRRNLPKQLACISLDR